MFKNKAHIYWLTPILILITATILLWMGREPICKCGYIKFWHGVVVSSENSQHLTDWYTPSHIIHGFLFYGLTFLVMKRFHLGWRLAVSTIIEAAWEIAENTQTVINRYREATVALDYFGDSVINSVADIGAMVFGFFLASKLPIWVIVCLAIIFELFTMWMIRDGLALNVIMLISPMDFIREWQSAG